MRDIVFRGKPIYDDKWMFGSLVKVADECVIIAEDAVYYGGSDFSKGCEVDPATIGQFTGMKDRNGKRIFEGDIFRCNDARGYVRFGTYASAYANKNTHIGFFIEWIIDRMLRIDLAFWTEQRKIEVIGNIHDNPEMMEGKR